MAESSWPCPNHNSRAVTDTEYEQLVAPSTANGIVGAPTDPAPVFGDLSGRQVKVRAGTYGLLRGHAWYSGSSDVVKTIAANTAGATRYDLIVLRLDRSTLDVSTAVVQGTAGSGPPSVTQQTGTTGVYEIPLAKVTVVNGASTIAATDVTNLAWYVGQQEVVCTSTTRPPPLAGLRIYETDTGRQYTGTGTAYSNGVEDTGWSTIGDVAGWTSSGAGILRRINGVTHLVYQARRTGAAVPANTPASLATLPPGYSPDRQVELLFWGTGSFVAHGYVTTNGVIVVSDYAVTINTNSVLIAHSASWPAA